MNTKKAIDILEDFISDFTAEGNNNMVEEFEQIIFLLQRGKAYEAMWGKLKKQYGYHFLKIMPNGIINEDYTINYFVEDLEQKYFPKEIIEEIVKGITEQIKEGAEIAGKEAEKQ